MVLAMDMWPGGLELHWFCKWEVLGRVNQNKVMLAHAGCSSPLEDKPQCVQFQ